MIAKDDMMGVLLDACPSFAPDWAAFLDEWQDEPGELPLYLGLARLARHLCGMLAGGEAATLPRVFAAVERLLVEGEEFVREAACVGLLEDLQNANLHEGTRPSELRKYLGPESERCWRELRTSSGMAMRRTWPNRYMSLKG